MKNKIKQRKEINKKLILENKSAQEEMVGFGLIIVLVAIIFIVFIAIYLKKPVEVTEDYEIGSFIQSTLQYTTICEDNNGNVTVQDLIKKIILSTKLQHPAILKLLLMKPINYYTILKYLLLNPFTQMQKSTLLTSPKAKHLLTL